jgi:Predicted membrane protein (DUF2232)
MLIPVGLGAGLASALLFAVVITGSPLALVLSYIAPLPIFVAALGWRHHAGLIATGVGMVAVSFALNVNVGVAFALGHGLPAWWIAYLALLGRSVMQPDGQDSTEWFPIGRLLLWIAIVAALITLAGALAISFDHARYQELMRGSLEAVLKAGSTPGGPLSGNVKPEDIARFAGLLAGLVPFVAGLSFFMMITANLWLAAKMTGAAKRLVRPIPFLPATQLPKDAAIALAFAAAGANFLPGFASLACAALAGALIMAFFLTGLATIHQMLGDRPWRVAALGALYLSLFLIFTIGLPVIALLGLADSLFNLRGTNPPPALPPTTDTQERKSPWT